MNNKLLEAIRQTLHPTTLEEVRGHKVGSEDKVSRYRLVRGDVATQFDIVGPIRACIRSDRITRDI